MCTAPQTHDFSADIKYVLHLRPLIFLLFPDKSIQIQMCTLRQAHDFFAYFLYRIIGNQMCTSSQTHNFSAFSFANIALNP